MFKVVCLGVLATAAASFSAQVLLAQSFDDPVRLKAGEQLAGQERLYPSPALYDVTGDGKLELVIGDLRGTLTYSVRTKDGWGEEMPMLCVDGRPLKFHNW